jgi:hypothetical protein
VGALAILGEWSTGLPPETLSRRKLRLEEEKEKAAVSPFMPPHYALSMSEKRGHDSVHAKGQTGEKVLLVTIYTRGSVTIALLDITTGLPKRPAHVVHPADDIRKEPAHSERSFCKTEYGALSIMNLGVRHQYHR